MASREGLSDLVMKIVLPIFAKRQFDFERM
jgi:hypothetical protein